MIAFDTNFLLRYLTRDDERQTGVVLKIMQSAITRRETIFISQITLCECLWVLSSLYRLPKIRLLQALEAMAEDDNLRLEDIELVRTALEDYRKGKADFPDYLIGRIAEKAGVSVTYTFDKALRGAKGFRVI